MDWLIKAKIPSCIIEKSKTFIKGSSKSQLYNSAGMQHIDTDWISFVNGDYDYAIFGVNASFAFKECKFILGMSRLQDDKSLICISVVTPISDRVIPKIVIDNKINDKYTVDKLFCENLSDLSNKDLKLSMNLSIDGNIILNSYKLDISNGFEHDNIQKTEYNNSDDALKVFNYFQNTI